MGMDKQTLSKCIADKERLIFDADIPEKYLSDALGRRKGTADALVFPLTTQEVSSVLRYAHENRIPVSSLSVAQMCEVVSDSPKNMEQRIRRTIAAGMSNIAHMGIEDFMNETYTLYSGTLFSFEDVKAEMDYLRGKRASGGKVSIKKFIDGLMLEVER